MTFRHLEFWPTLFTALAVLVMGTLGFWQVERLQWKENQIAQLAAAEESGPLQELPTTAEAIENKNLYLVTLTGYFLPPDEFHVAGKYFGKELGYHILMPFQTEQGVVLVNRGWVPAEMKERAARPELEVAPVVHKRPKDYPRVTLTGRIHLYKQPWLKVVDNQPEKNLWFYYDYAMMNERLGYTLLPAWVELIGEQGRTALPVPGEKEVHLRNDHLGYAITWFGMALSFIVMFIFYQRRSA